MLDRARIGSVIDFVHLSYQAWSFAIFNVADTAITIGAIAIMVSLFLDAA
ncbi:signal peptidase II [Pseudomonas sp. FW305-47B]